MSTPEPIGIDDINALVRLQERLLAQLSEDPTGHLRHASSTVLSLWSYLGMHLLTTTDAEAWRLEALPLATGNGLAFARQPNGLPHMVTEDETLPPAPGRPNGGVGVGHRR